MLLFGHSRAKILLKTNEIRQALVNLHEEVGTGASDVFVA
jgi:hypothetical protein